MPQELDDKPREVGEGAGTRATEDLRLRAVGDPYDINSLERLYARAPTLPTDAAARKRVPLARGLLDYFPSALAAVAELSQAGNDKHNPGEELHHARGKSGDHADCILRHLLDRGTLDPEDGLRHSAKVAWRALALLQEELETAGAPMARGAKP